MSALHHIDQHGRVNKKQLYTIRTKQKAKLTKYYLDCFNITCGIWEGETHT